MHFEPEKQKNPDLKLGGRLHRKSRLSTDYSEQNRLIYGMRKAGIDDKRIQEIFRNAGIDMIEPLEILSDVPTDPPADDGKETEN